MDPVTTAIIAAWATIPPEWQVVAVVGVPIIGAAAAFVVKRTKTQADDALLDKAKGLWKRIRGQA
ncbi:MAG: hypothetical protein A2Y38_00445 [Spirochaetes bacterium GWB1_59_5]|nr:MAG: hypothetical protein A2Y38_00445 [Spirochaetes bacterium GWB1_59_5]